MRSRRPLAAALGLALALVAPPGCPAPDDPDVPGPADVADTSPGPLPACPEQGTLYAVDAELVRTPLQAGAELGVILGFQGFQFSQVGLVSPLALDSPARVSVFVEAPDKLDLYSVSSALRPTPADAGWETPAVLVFFNDVPLAELIGLEATLTLRATAGDCSLSASVDVVLAAGGFMGRDSPIWADASSGSDAR